VNQRVLGRTGLRVSVVAFGAGPVSGLMTGHDAALQRATVERAVALGVNWFDTAAGYGDGRSEANLGRVLAELGAADRVHVATKVRVPGDRLADPAETIVQSVRESLVRLRLPRVTLLQLHNGITTGRGDEANAVTPADVLRPGGILAGLERVKAGGLARFLGLTGTGHPAALREVVRSGGFDTVQSPYNLLNPSAGRPGAPSEGDTDYGNIFADCAAAGVGVFAIRVFAGGALLGRPPSAHTLKTPYFPLSLYERDAARAAGRRSRPGPELPMPVLAVRYALAHPAVCSAIIGIGAPADVDGVVGGEPDGPLPPGLEMGLG
jgi:aryl-alcohol dehydrogenase-like predicted oxidoreductase